MKKVFRGNLVCKMLFILVMIALWDIVSAQTEIRFFMEIDTTYNGIRVGQEFELKYRCPVRFDSIRPPDFGNQMEVVKGPIPHRGSSMLMVNGERMQTEENGFSYHVRFLSEGVINLPVASVTVGDKRYDTPPLAVRVKPALKDMRDVECRLSTRAGQGGNIRVILTSNRRPDNLTPFLRVGDYTYQPSGKNSSLSYKRDTTGSSPGGVKVTESYEFYYNIPSNDRKTDAYTVENLSFGGIPYPWDDRKAGADGTSSEGSNKRMIIVVLIGCILLFGGMWWRFHREADEALAGFVLRHKRLNLSTDRALTHYGFPLFLVSIPSFFILINLYDYFVEGRSDLFFPWFLGGLLPGVLALATYFNQRRKLNFRPMPTSLSADVLREVVEETARKNNWTIDHAGEDCIVAHTHPHGLGATWGEQVFVVFDKGQVWLNSVNDLHKRSAVFSCGYTKKNIHKLQEAIGSHTGTGQLC